MPDLCRPQRAQSPAPPTWQRPETCAVQPAGPWGTEPTSGFAPVATSPWPTLEQAAQVLGECPEGGEASGLGWAEEIAVEEVGAGPRSAVAGAAVEGGAGVGKGAGAEGGGRAKAARQAPIEKMYDGRVSRDEHGGVWGAGAHGGVKGQTDGIETRGLFVGAEGGWGGERELYGLSVGGTFAGVESNPTLSGSSGFWGGLRFADAGYDANHSFETGMGQLGYRADVLSGDIGARSVNRHSASDRGVKFGASWGAPSASVRWYCQDVDEDGIPEIGRGLTLPGPFGLGVSVDYVSETPVGDMVSMVSPITIPIQAGMTALGAERYTPAVHIQRLTDTVWPADCGLDRPDAVGETP